MNAEAELRAKLDEIRSDRLSLEKRLSAVLAENEKLAIENVDLNNVCQELMVLVEEQTPKSHT